MQYVLMHRFPFQNLPARLFVKNVVLPRVVVLVMDQLLEVHGFISLNIYSPTGLSICGPITTTFSNGLAE